MMSGVVLLSLGGSVYAVENPLKARLDDIKEKRVEKLEDRIEKASSRPGVLRGLLNKKRAVISKGSITAKNSTSITVEKDGKSFSINIDSNTKFERRFWGKTNLDEMKVGDTVNVVGTWSDEAQTTIIAKLIRDISIQKRFGVFIGEVKSLLSNGWVMTTISSKRADQTVTVDSSTKFSNRKGETITQSEITVGQRVRVKGLWNSNDNTVTEVTEVKDFALPVWVSATATITATASPTSTE